MFTEEDLKKFVDSVFEKHGSSIVEMTKDLISNPHLSFDEKMGVMDGHMKNFKKLAIIFMYDYCMSMVEKPVDEHPRETWENQLEIAINERIKDQLSKESIR